MALTSCLANLVCIGVLGGQVSQVLAKFSLSKCEALLSISRLPVDFCTTLGFWLLATLFLWQVDRALSHPGIGKLESTSLIYPVDCH
jgi:hypothetical protein